MITEESAAVECLWDISMLICKGQEKERPADEVIDDIVKMLTPFTGLK